MKKTFLLLFVTILFIGIGVAYYMYNKKAPDVSHLKTDFIMSADEIFTTYSEDETTSNTKYLDKIFELNGKVQELNMRNESEPTLVLMAADGEGTVSCGFKPEHKTSIEKFKAGDSVKIKGQCKGLSGDASLDLLAAPEVVFTNCTIIE